MAKRGLQSETPSHVPFQLTPMILKNVRRFKPVPVESLRSAADALDAEGEGSDLVLLIRLGSDLNALMVLSDEEKPDGSDALQPYKAAVLHLMAKRGSGVCVRRLLSFGAFLERRDSNGETCLNVAAANGKLPVVKYLIDAGADVNSPSPSGWTVLMEAASRGHPEVVTLLLESGAEKDALDEDGMTAVIAASGMGEVEVLRVLLQANADVHKFGMTGPTALMFASKNGETAAIRVLLEEGGVEVNEIGFLNTSTALHDAALGGHADAVRVLAAAGAYLDAESAHGRTALILASSMNHVETVEVLLEAGADVNIIDSGHCSSLFHASEQGHEEIVQVLIDAGADVEGSEFTGAGMPAQSPLMAAAYEGHAGVVRLLLEGKAKLDRRDAHGFTALSLAAQNDHMEVLQILKAAEEMNVS